MQKINVIKLYDSKIWNAFDNPYSYFKLSQESILRYHQKTYQRKFIFIKSILHPYLQ